MRLRIYSTESNPPFDLTTLESSTLQSKQLFTREHLEMFIE